MGRSRAAAESAGTAGPVGVWRLADPETQQSVSADLPTVAARYQARLGAHLEQLRQGCAARAVGWHLLRTDEAVPAALRRVLG